MTKVLLASALLGSLYVTCGEGDRVRPTVSRASGNAGETTGESEGAGSDGLGGTTWFPEGGRGPDTQGGAGGWVSSTIGGQRNGAAGGASSAAAAGAAGQGPGVGEPPAATPINGCIEFIDARASTELRRIGWGYGLGHDSGRCLLVQVGQRVTWQGPFSTHPLQPFGGTTPSPIIGDAPADATAYEVVFGWRGTFGYECGLHATMRGAIRVVE